MWKNLDTVDFPPQQKGCILSYGWDNSHPNGASHEQSTAVLLLSLPAKSSVRVQVYITGGLGGVILDNLDAYKSTVIITVMPSQGISPSY